MVNWTPAHKDVPGNEEAKCATVGDVEKCDHTFPSLLLHALPHNRNSLRNTSKQQQTAQSELEWTQSPRYTRLAAINDALSPPPYQKAIVDIHATIIFQLRTGYIILNDLHHRIKMSTVLTAIAAATERQYSIISLTALAMVANEADYNPLLESQTCASVPFSPLANTSLRSCCMAAMPDVYKAHFRKSHCWTSPMKRKMIERSPRVYSHIPRHALPLRDPS